MKPGSKVALALLLTVLVVGSGLLGLARLFLFTTSIALFLFLLGLTQKLE